MEYRKVAGIDKPVSRIVFGTDRVRSRRLSWVRDRSLEHQTFSLSDPSFELGCNSFDTAHIYEDSERTLGAWMRKGRNRDKVVVVSKERHPDGSRQPRLSASDVSHDLHASLNALGAGFIDSYLHYVHPTARVEPVPEQLNHHVDEGKITAICVSNWSHERIDDANAVAASHGLKLLCASTVEFSLADSTRSPWPGAATIGGEGQRAARDWYSKDSLSVFARSTLSRGFFPNHYRPKYPAANRVSQWCATYFGTEKNIQRLERMRMFARRHHVTVAQAALAYVLRYPLQVFAIVGCTTLEKSVNNVGAQSLKRDGAALQWLATGEALR